MQNTWKKAFWAVEWSWSVLSTVTNTSFNFEVKPLRSAATRATSSIVSDVVNFFLLNVTYLIIASLHSGELKFYIAIPKVAHCGSSLLKLTAIIISSWPRLFNLLFGIDNYTNRSGRQSGLERLGVRIHVSCMHDQNLYMHSYNKRIILSTALAIVLQFKH